MREKKIILELYESNAYRDLEYFSKKLGVSTRTISNDMKYLMQIQKANGFELLRKRKEGYYLKIIDANLVKAFMADEDQMIQTSAESRLKTLLVRLLLENKYCTQEELAEALAVSKSLIKLDMNKVEANLKKWDLVLHKKAHFGVCVLGSLEQRRQYLLSLSDSEEAKQLLDAMVGEDVMKQLDKKLVHYLKEYDLNTNYAEMIKLDQYLKIVLCLQQNGFKETCRDAVMDGIPMEIAQKLAVDIKALLKVNLQVEDQMAIACFLKQKTRPKRLLEEVDKELEADIMAFLQAADHEYDTAFSEDAEFKKSLLAHVSLLLDRLHQSISFDNPLVKEISAKYPVIFNISIKFANMLEDRYHVKATQDEIGFIATHFAAHLEKEYRNQLYAFQKIAIICSSGGGSAFLIKLKLETIFPNSDIQTFSFLELEDVHSFTPDIIFTIKQLEEAFDVPIVLIKELLDDEDIHKIKNMFEFTKDKKRQNQPLSFHSLFKKDCFWILEAGSYQELLHMMAKQVTKQGYSNAEYETNVIEREKVLSTVYHAGVAIPHPIEMCAHENMIAMGIVKHDLQEEGKPVKLIFLVNLSKGDLKIHQDISRVLFEVMSDEKLVQRIQSATSYDEFKKNISMLEF